MNKAAKWGIFVIGLVVILLIGAVVVVPRVVDVKQYKPRLEALVAEQTGRPFSMGEDLSLSLFPWVGVRLTDLTLGNGPGFKDGPLAAIKSFEVRLKVMPLLSRRIEVDSLVLDSPRIALVKDRSGKGNWEGLGPARGAEPPGKDPKPPAGELPIASLMVGRLAVVNGQLSFTDQGTGQVRAVSDLNLDVTEISLDQPMKIEIKAMADGLPLAVAGTLGPLGKSLGQEGIGLDLNFKALDLLGIQVKGSLALSGPALDARVGIDPFSPRTFFEKLGQAFPVETRDPKALGQVSLSAAVKGSLESVSLTEGLLKLDETTVKFSAALSAFEKPEIRADLDVDQIDLDRYLAPKAEQGDQGQDAGKAAAPSDGAKPDYTPLRRLVLDSKAAIGSLKAANLTLTNLAAQIKGRDGLFTLDPFTLELYQGHAQAWAKVDFRGEAPKTQLRMTTKGVQAGPLVRDGAGKDIIEGALAADLELAMTGDGADQIRKSLGGKGGLTFTDGAIKGIDVAGTIRDAASGLGLKDKPDEKPKTDFAELMIPYTADQGLVTVTGATLASPLLRLAAQGKTHLVEESLDFKVEPKLVATLKGQGDAKDRSGLLIPLLVKGSWTDPKIRPDLESMVKGKLTDPESLKQMIQGDTGGEAPVSTEEKAKSLLKGIFQ